MGTVTITTAGYANMPATPPANWPSYVTFPANSPTNGSHSFTVSDADWLRILTWVATTQFSASGGGRGQPIVPASPTVLQMAIAWATVWWNGTIQAEQQLNATPPSLPTPIGVT